MRPLGIRVWRKNRHRAWRGLPRGRRSTHPIETTYGRHQEWRDYLARRDTLRATAGEEDR